MRETMLLLALIAGCEPDRSEWEPLSETMTVDAAAGATLTLRDGATLTVPAGALSASADITFSRSCGGVYASSRFAGCRYQVAGGDWADRFTVSMPVVEAIAVRDAADGLRRLVDSEETAGRVRATASSEGSFTSRSATGVFDDDRCTDVPTEACGGDLEGDWVLSLACGTSWQLGGSSWSGSDPYATCAEDAHLEDYPFTISGSLSFTDEGAYEERSAHTMAKRAMTTIECLDAVGETCGSDLCEVKGTICDCTIPDWATGVGGVSGSWAYGTDGEVLLDGSSATYCVDGDTLTITFSSSTGPYVMIYDRG